MCGIAGAIDMVAERAVARVRLLKRHPERIAGPTTA